LTYNTIILILLITHSNILRALVIKKYFNQGALKTQRVFHANSDFRLSSFANLDGIFFRFCISRKIVQFILFFFRAFLKFGLVSTLIVVFQLCALIPSVLLLIYAPYNFPGTYFI